MATKAAPKKATSQEASKKKTSSKRTSGRAQDRSKVAGGQEYEVGYESKKTGASATMIKEAIKTAGNSRKKIETTLKKK